MTLDQKINKDVYETLKRRFKHLYVNQGEAAAEAYLQGYLSSCYNFAVNRDGRMELGMGVIRYSDVEKTVKLILLEHKNQKGDNDDFDFDVEEVEKHLKDYVKNDDKPPFYI